MNRPESCLYLGELVHKRLKPVRHELRYRVYNLFIDVDDLPRLDKTLRVFSYNRFNLLGIADRNHGSGDESPIREQLSRLAATVSCGSTVTRFFIFCYPRVLGYVFNPLTVYYGYDAQGLLKLMIYEVNNTFGGRKSYVVPYSGEHRQSVAKALYVSPFNAVEGNYGFHLVPPGEHLSLGVTLTTSEGPLFKAYFSGDRQPLTDATLLRLFFSLPMQSLKVIGAIHWEAMKLWRKGLSVKPRVSAPQSAINSQSRDTP